MRSIYFSLISIFVITAVMFSCEKEKPGIEKTLSNKKVEFRGDTLDYNDCPAIKDSVYKTGDMLVFKDEEHFEKCALCLEYDYENYNNDYEDDYPDATAEELDSLDIVNNFDEWAPYLQFENNLNFSSLRADLESEIVQWLDSTPADSLDFDDDPDDSTPVNRISYRALLNENGYAIVGSDTISSNDWVDDLSYDCSFLKTRKTIYTESTNPELEDRMIKVRITVMSGIVTSKLIGEITHYKLEGGKFKRKRANLRLYIQGRGYHYYGEDCDMSPQYWSKWTSYKKRKSLQVTDIIWGLWREALVNTKNPNWGADHCVTWGYWEAEQNLYPSHLAKK